jgi:hypothetical protein
VSLAVNETQRVALSQYFVHDVTQLPRHDSVVHGGESEGDRPKGGRTLGVESADDC